MQLVRTLRGDDYEFKDGTSVEEMREHLAKAMKVSLDDWVIQLKRVDDDSSDKSNDKSKGSDKNTGSEWLAWVEEAPPSDEWVKICRLQGVHAESTWQFQFYSIHSQYTTFRFAFNTLAALHYLPAFHGLHAGDTWSNTAYNTLRECMEAESTTMPSRLLLNQADARFYSHLCIPHLCPSILAGRREFIRERKALKVDYPQIAWDEWFLPTNRYRVSDVSLGAIESFYSLLRDIRLPAERLEEVNRLWLFRRYGYMAA